MNRILNFKSVENATVRISCGSKTGTGFFVDTESESKLLLTADHVLADADTDEIHVEIEGVQVKCSIVNRLLEKDVAFLRPDRIAEEISSVPLLSDILPYNTSWEAFGYPVQRISSGARFSGIISRTNEGTKWDIDLECVQYKNLDEFGGLSGAPLVVDGYVTGIIIYDIVGGLGATSISSIETELRALGVSPVVRDGKSVPDSIQSQLIDTTPNTNVFDKINEAVLNRPNSRYFLLSGSPGSGKTTIAAQLEFDKNHVICDRYFVKVPDQDSVPTQIRATSEYFLRWVEEVYSRVLFNRPPDRQREDVKLHEQIALIQQGINSLGDYYNRSGKVGYLVIDGLDDIAKGSINNFLSVLPISLPSGLKVIFCCTSKSILPIGLQSTIASEDEVKVTPLPLEKAEQFLREQLQSQNIPISQIAELATKSEGHPLYLRYLSKFVQNLEDVSVLEDWIATIPVIHGEIETYYNRIWLQIQGPDEIWVAGTLSRTRIPISREELYSVLPTSAQYAFPVALPKIEHLLQEDDKLSIYHTSFSDFINEKTATLEKEIRDNIASYCTKHEDTFFTISEKVYQLANGSADRRIQSVNICNQAWVDKCVFFGVNPDIVLSDIRLVIAVAADLGVAYKVIELLLLSQRVNFRYNRLFEENATYLVNALLALGKYEDALRYVVRNNTLVVSDGDALYLLQRFYEYGADEEAEILLKSIKRTCDTVIEKGMDSESFTRYMNLRFSSVTLSANADPTEAYHEFSHIKRTAEKMLKASGNSLDVIHNFKDEKGSYNIGYYIWRFNIPPLTKETERQKLHDFTDKSSGFTALCIYQAIHFSEISPLTKREDNIAAWVQDLEYLIDKYGINSEYYFSTLFVLNKYSKRNDLIEKIYNKFFSPIPLPTFRKANGVDLDRRHVEKYFLYEECRANLDASDKVPTIIPFRISNWESGIANRCQTIGFFFSQARKFSSIEEKDKLTKVEPLVRNFVTALIPDLRQRMHWERSYGLPEEIFPLIYDKCTELLSVFFPACIPCFLEQITSNRHYQLGLYTEGYTDSLLAISRRFTKCSNFEAAFEVAKVLESHVLNTVENRWERNEYLLRLVELYAEIENVDKADEMFSEMVDTSMGPSWYKEAQLGIVNTVVSTIIPKSGDYTYLQKFAAHLYNASGEMTFQRYVKQQQEQFVGDLTKVGFLRKATDYLKYQLLPDYKTIIENAESGLIDMPNEGDGYVLGARAIEEQAGVLDMLRAITFDSSLVVYAFTELFMLGDDRYILGYSKIQAKILNSAELTDLSKVDLLLSRIVRFYLAELDEQFRTEYVTSLTDNLSPGNLAKLKTAFADSGILDASLDKEESQDSPDSSYSDLIDSLPTIKVQALSKLHTGNKSGARKIIIEALDHVQKNKFGIWSSNYSNKINELRELLALSFNSSEELIKDLQGLLVNEPYFEEWVIADELIGLLRNTTDEDEKQRILSVVENHIYLMVRTPEVVVDKYNWLADGVDSTLHHDYLLTELLIWFLNHPSFSLKNRSVELLAWLGKVEPSLVIPALSEEIISDGYKLSKELCASILHQLAEDNPLAFYNEFERILKAKGEQLFAVRHFMIQNSLFEALEVVGRKTNCDIKSYIAILGKNLDHEIVKGGEVELDEVYLSPFDEHLYSLNGLGVLNKTFATDLLTFIDESKPLSMPDCLKANKYINRSFNNFNDVYLVPDIDNLVRYAINYSIFPQVSLTNREHIADILRYYQPTFSESKLAHFRVDCSKFDDNLKRLFIKEEVIDWQELFDGDLYISYYNSCYSPHKKYYEEVELVAYVVPADNNTMPFGDFSPKTFRSNTYPIGSDPEGNSIPLAIICDEHQHVTGGDIIPSVANPKFFNDKDFAADDLRAIYWRNGRNWEQKRQGVYHSSGYSIQISNSVKETIRKDYQLFWDIHFGYDRITVDIFNKKIL